MREHDRYTLKTLSGHTLYQHKTFNQAWLLARSFLERTGVIALYWIDEQGELPTRAFRRTVDQSGREYFDIVFTSELNV